VLSNPKLLLLRAGRSLRQAVGSNFVPDSSEKLDGDKIRSVRGQTFARLRPYKLDSLERPFSDIRFRKRGIDLLPSLLPSANPEYSVNRDFRPRVLTLDEPRVSAADHPINYACAERIVRWPRSSPIFIMAAHPEGTATPFIAALRHQIEIVIIHIQHVDTTRIS